ncbi:MAG: hypothetical protein HY820_14530 [Acidobacteria bacterium]|nr:hypothetical protein [Acidobacteriota bacterium]
MRSLLNLGVVASLLLSFAQAPFLHAHASDPHHEHARGLTHTHWKAPPASRSLEADDHDSDARMIDWLAGDGSAAAKFVLALPDTSAEIVLIVRVVRIPELTTHNHDPPWRLIPHLRGPPA